MDVFADNNLIVKDMINQIRNNNKNKKKTLLIDTGLIQKQYHVYYLYRIICKYFSFFRSMALVNSIREINETLLIPSNYKYVCYPLAGHLTTNEAILDKAFDLMLNLFRNAKAKLIETQRSTDSDIEEFLETKTPEVIINDIKELIKYVPGISSHLLPPIYS
jgi:hypothetical protein